MELLQVLAKLPEHPSVAHIVAAVLIAIIWAAIAITRHLCAPGMERLSAKQKQKEALFTQFNEQARELRKERARLIDELKQCETSSGRLKNQLAIISVSYEWTMGALHRISEISTDVPADEHKMALIREICRESANMKTIKEIFNE